jgi:hypothetical protein
MRSVILLAHGTTMHRGDDPVQLLEDLVRIVERRRG